MTTILIACGAALAAMALAATVFLLGRRSGGAGEDRLAALAAQLDERMEGMVRDLSEALERAQEENRRSRVLGELGGTIDLDEVLTRTLDATGALAGVDAAVISVAVEGDEPLVASMGLSPGEPAAAVSGHRTDPRRARLRSPTSTAPATRTSTEARSGRRSPFP